MEDRMDVSGDVGEVLLPPSGKILHVAEIVEDGSVAVNGSSVRTMGRVIDHDHETRMLKIEAGGACLNVNASLVGDLSLRPTSMYQFIGEIERTKGGLQLNARIGRCVDGIDATLYYKVLELRRKFLKEYER